MTDPNFEVEETAVRVARDKGVSYAEALREIQSPFLPNNPIECEIE